MVLVARSPRPRCRQGRFLAETLRGRSIPLPAHGAASSPCVPDSQQPGSDLHLCHSPGVSPLCPDLCVRHTSDAGFGASNSVHPPLYVHLQRPRLQTRTLTQYPAVAPRHIFWGHTIQTVRNGLPRRSVCHFLGLLWPSTTDCAAETTATVHLKF